MVVEDRLLDPRSSEFLGGPTPLGGRSALPWPTVRFEASPRRTRDEVTGEEKVFAVDGLCGTSVRRRRCAHTRIHRNRGRGPTAWRSAESPLAATPDNLSAPAVGSGHASAIQVPQAHAITGGSPRRRRPDRFGDRPRPPRVRRPDRHGRQRVVHRRRPVHDPSGALWRDNVGHGTHVAGIIAAGDNGFGTVGMAPNVQLLIVKVTDPGVPITPMAVACAFEYVSGQHADVVNASFAVDKGATGGADPLDFFCRSDTSRPASDQARRNGRPRRDSVGGDGPGVGGQQRRRHGASRGGRRLPADARPAPRRHRGRERGS